MKAVQQGRTIFALMASFSRVEMHSPVAQWPMPKVRSPGDSMKQEDVFQHLADNESDQNRKEYILQYVQVCKYDALVLSAHYPMDSLQDRKNSPIEIRVATDIDSTELPVHYWYRARAVPKFEAPYQKVSVTLGSELVQFLD